MKKFVVIQAEYDTDALIDHPELRELEPLVEKLSKLIESNISTDQLRKNGISEIRVMQFGNQKKILAKFTDPSMIGQERTLSADKDLVKITELDSDQELTTILEF